ncbi:hypothetical protein [Variovorax sp. dw_308]|uniref:hypothetical protein n=1 Tax=Variovorax sp. dw_308 TaxID=2721546 RepID=UPI001C482D71|nr:hypothetical protein [Variovorax sp. dw_308]
MNHSDFTIGGEFWCGGAKWRCTDKGTRVIIAIKLEHADPNWYSGPTYAVAEQVFDEDDFGGCSLSSSG